jgi:hypothetical protein
MKLKDFINENKQEIDTIIYDYYRVVVKNNRERKLWILDDEGLYRWAHREGVNI